MGAALFLWPKCDTIDYMDHDDGLRIRNVDRDIWRQFRAEAVRRGVPVGALLTEVISQWLSKQRSVRDADIRGTD